MLRLFAAHAAQQFQRHAANRAFSALAASAAGGMGGVAARRWGSVWKKCRPDAAAAAPGAATCGAPFDFTQAPYSSTVDLDFSQLTPLAFARRFSAGTAASGGNIPVESANKPSDKAAASSGIGGSDNVYLHHTNVGSNVQAAAVTVGLIHALEPLCPGIGYFRPIDCTTHGGNRAELMRKIFRLSSPARDMYGVTQDRATTLLHANRVDDLLDDVLMSYERCRREHDFMVVEGTSLKDGTISAPVNGLIASALGAPAILLTDARVAAESSHPNFTMEEIDWEADAATRRSMHPDSPPNFTMEEIDWEEDAAQTSILVAATVVPQPPLVVTPLVNVPPPPAAPSAPRTPRPCAPAPPPPPRSALRSAHGSAHPLRFPSRPASASRAASRSGPRLRDYIEAHSRSQAYIRPSEHHQHQPIPLSQAKADKRVAAVVLSGGTPPTLTIDHMIRSTNLSASLPVLLSPLDPHVICLSIARAHSALHASSPAKIRRARDLFQEHADTPAIHRILFQEASSAHPAHVTPRVFECGIFSKAREAQSHVVLAKGTEPKVVQAAGEVLRRSLCKLTLLGNPEEVLLQAKNQCVDLSGANILDPGASPDLDRYVELICQAQLERGVTMSVEEARRLLLSDPASFGSAMVAAGEADGMAVGGIRPNGNGRIVRGVIKTRPEMPVVSGVVFMCLPDKVLVYGDSAENTLPLIGSSSTAVAPSLGASAPTNGIATADPTAEELAMIAMSSADTAAAFGVEPRVALLSTQASQQGAARAAQGEGIKDNGSS
ncbi:unnamed protein product [Closterium sp. NIES-65]|nr:unnamed protein product [Closterium sp. NIES-65]